MLHEMVNVLLRKFVLLFSHFEMECVEWLWMKSEINVQWRGDRE